MSPLKKFQITGSLEIVSEEPHINIEEMAATCCLSVLGARPNLNLSCRNSKICAMEVQVEISLCLLHQVEKVLNIAR